MNASNNFTVVGFICKDAEVRNFEKSSIARFGISIKTTEKKGGVEITSSSIQNFETWIKNDDQALLDLLKKGKRVKVEGFFKRCLFLTYNLLISNKSYNFAVEFQKSGK